MNHLFSVLAANWVWDVAALILGIMVGWLSYPAASRRQLTR
jgi:hypothetical protein